MNKTITIALLSVMMLCITAAPTMAEETCWGDTFSDETGIATMHNLTIANGDVNIGYFEDWDYRRPITISNTAGDIIDYPVKLVYNFSAEYSARKIQQYCDDIRFTYYNTTSGAEIEIPYWVETCSLTANDNATIWMRIPFMASNANATAYMYFGNSRVSSASNKSAVFEGSTYEPFFQLTYNPSFPPKNQNHYRRAARLQNFRYLLVVIFFI